MRKKKSPGPPVNPVAKALARGGYAPRIVKSGKIYSRKIKHRNREYNPGSLFSANQMTAVSRIAQAHRTDLP